MFFFPKFNSDLIDLESASSIIKERSLSNYNGFGTPLYHKVTAVAPSLV